jgi:pimeloyl-ACP methyl ester carboxylesterase
MFAPGVRFEEFVWQPRVDGRQRDFVVNTYMTEGADAPNADQTHVYLGLGEERFASKGALKTLGKNGLAAISVVLPFHHLPPEPKYFEQVLEEVPIAFAVEMQERTDSNKPASLIGHSQGGGVVLIAGSQAPDLFDNIAAISPVGLNGNFMGDTPEAKRAEFIKRFMVYNAIMHTSQWPHHLGNFVAGPEIGSRVAKDIYQKRFVPKLNYALNVDGVPIVEAAVDGGCNVAVFAAENDPVFPPSELRASLETAGLEHLLTTVPGSHSSPLVRGGRKQFEIAAQWIVNSRQTAQV